MENFTFYSPTRFVFGRGAELRAGELVRALGGTRALIVYGGGSVKHSGLYDRVVASLEAAGVSHCELGGALPNPRSGLVYAGIELARRKGADFVLSVGGGSAIDTGKAIALGIPYAGDFWDFFCGKATPAAAAPHGVIPTLPAAGSEGSNSCVITQEDGMLKRGLNIDLNRPLFALMNPELTFTLPPYQTACGIVDMFSHVLERYFTNTQSVGLTDRMAEALMRSILAAAPEAMRDPSDYDARATLFWAGTLAHNDSVGVGREQDWSSHRIGHELSARYDCAHGAVLSVLFPAWMRHVYRHDVMRFAQYAMRVWGAEMDFAHPEKTALEGIARTAAFFASLDMPRTLAQLGAKEEDIPSLAAGVVRAPDGTCGRFVRLDTEAIEAILRLAAHPDGEEAAQ